MSYLLDTNVISEARKSNPNAGVADWFDEADSDEMYLGVLVVGEIRHGIELLRRRRDRNQADLLERWLASLRREFADRLLPITLAIAERWGLLNAAQPLPVADGLLAATAIEHDLTLVTRDTAALAGSGARLLNPWRD